MGGSGINGRTPVFILGLNNSGTSILMEVLKHNSKIDVCLRESDGAASRIMPSVRRYAKTEMETSGKGDHGRVYTEGTGWIPEQFTQADVHNCLKAWVRVQSGEDGDYLVMKSVIDIIRAEWIQYKFGPCKFIILIRNPYDTVMSIMKSGITVERAVRHWKLAHEILLESMPNLNDMMVIHYEELFDDDGFARIEDFLGVPNEIDINTIVIDGDRHYPGTRNGKIYNRNVPMVGRRADIVVNSVNESCLPVMKTLGIAPL
jgi:hypothetical protein